MCIPRAVGAQDDLPYVLLLFRASLSSLRTVQCEHNWLLYQYERVVGTTRLMN